MARYSRIEVAQRMAETGMVPLFYHPDVELGKQVLKACYDGGARLMEFTARGDFAHEVFADGGLIFHTEDDGRCHIDVPFSSETMPNAFYH